MKKIVADILECRYEEGPGRLMALTITPDLLALKRTRGNLLFKQVENKDLPPHVVVFGWMEKCELLLSGKTRVSVTPLSTFHQRVLLDSVQEVTEGKINFWQPAPP